MTMVLYFEGLGLTDGDDEEGEEEAGVLLLRLRSGWPGSSVVLVSG